MRIQIFLNPFNDGRQALVFGVNPLGIQSDGALVEGSNNRGGALFSALESGREVTDLTPDYVYQSKGRLTADGYEIEIAIPFKTLRYPTNRVQSWALERRAPRAEQRPRGQLDAGRCAPRARSSRSRERIDGLTDLHRGLVLDLNPVVTAHSDGVAAGDRWNYDTGRPEFGGNVRWGVTPNLTLNGTVNPDFSQVEADASQFTFDPRSALFFPEKRPFFLDGAELFTSPNNLIYTRRIAAPLTAVKLTGNSAGTDIALLSAIDDPATSASGVDRPVFNIARLQHDLPQIVEGRPRLHRPHRRQQLQPGVRRRRAPAVRLDLQPAAAGRREPHDHRRARGHGAHLAGDLQPRRAALRTQISDQPASTRTSWPGAASSAAAG